MRALLLSALVVAAAAVGACTSTVVDNAAVIVDGDATDESAVTYQAPTQPSNRIYYGVPVGAYISAATIPSHWVHFDLLPRGKVDLVVDHEDGRRRTGMRIYRVNPTGSLRLLGHVAGRGHAAAHIESRAGGTIVVEAFGTTPREGSTITITVDCARRDGQCAPLGQPGATCGTRGAGQCDDGLYCDFDAMCGADDRGGSCSMHPVVCSRMACVELCGCDGQTYCGECAANVAGVSIAHEGACEAPVCDPSVYEMVKDEVLNTVVNGVWTGTGLTTGYDVNSTLRLNDGDFSYDQTWNPTCLRSDPPCRQASRLFSMVGGWNKTATSVQLTPEVQPAPEQLAWSFTIVQNCEGDVRLRTTEMGEDRELTRDLCADHSCGDNEHCEVVPVMCIQAPCPPQPTCVAN